MIGPKWFSFGMREQDLNPQVIVDGDMTDVRRHIVHIVSMTLGLQAQKQLLHFFQRFGESMMSRYCQPECREWMNISMKNTKKPKLRKFMRNIQSVKAKKLFCLHRLTGEEIKKRHIIHMSWLILTDSMSCVGMNMWYCSRCIRGFRRMFQSRISIRTDL